MRRQTTKELISDVRSLIDEDNQEGVKDETDIIPALCRAQKIAANILSRQFQPPLLKRAIINTSANQSEYDIPKDAFEQRLVKIEISVNGNTYSDELTEISYRDATPYERSVGAGIPFYWSQESHQFRLYPTPSAGYSLRLTYMERPLPLVKEQGRVTLINTTSRYVIVEELGDDITSLMSDLNSYVNVVDGETGKIKVSLQIQAIDGKKVTFKSAPNRTSVLGRNIGNSLADIGLDDLLCVVSGTCVPVFKDANSDFIIAHAVAEIKAIKLDGEIGMTASLVEDLQKRVKSSWSGRNLTLRVKRTGRVWNNSAAANRYIRTR